MMNVLVVGGAGYIGSHCVRQLVAAGHRPVVLDSFVFGHRNALMADLPLYEGSLGDRPLLESILRDESIDLVMHFAAFAYVGESMQDPLKYYENNVSQTISLLQAMRAVGVSKFVFSSSCTVYGYAETMPMSESTPIQPINAYGQTKRDVEVMLEYCARAYGMSCAVFRYFNASGAAEDGSIGEDHHPETHLIPLAIQAAQGKRGELTVFGQDYPTPDGTCLRDYIHVDDLSRAHIAVFPLLEQGSAYMTYNLGTGVPASVLDVINEVEAVSGLKVPYVFGERRPGDAAEAYADNRKAMAELGWEPKFKTLRSIIETAWAWHSTRPDGYPK